MSTLTKVLIVLLTVASIFLCGIVVTYVAGAVDYKQKHDDLSRRYQAAREAQDNANSQFNELKNRTDEEKLGLNKQIGGLQEQMSKLQANLTQTEIDRDDARRKEDTWEALAKDFAERVETNNQLTAKAQAGLAKVNAELITERAQHEQTSTTLLEKMAVISRLEDRTRQLVEEKTELQSKFDKMLREYGRITAEPVPVTTMPEEARVAPPGKQIDLKGLITSVDLPNKLAEISIGEAGGVKQGMRFHATRGETFICDVVILDVEPETATGWIELLKEGPENQPKAGDQVRTNL